MKKISTFLVIVLLSFAFVGCNNQDQNNNKNTPYENQFNDISYEECTYILNKRSKKFHYKDCFTVKLMNEHNNVYCNDKRESIIEYNYIPCLKCNP